MENGIPVIAGESNIGLGRSRNEDSYCIVAPPGFACRLAVVSDGIGGHSDGDVASMFCCRRLMHDFMRRGNEIADENAAARFIREEFAAVNRQLYERNEFDRRVRPMGSTVICAVFTPGTVTFCGAGDSRIYEYDPATENLMRLSKDDVGCDGSSLCRAVGISCRLAAEPESRPLGKGCVYLLCSDGLHHFVSDAEIASVLVSAASARMAVSMLMRRALLHNAGDNITVVAAYPPKLPEPAVC